MLTSTKWMLHGTSGTTGRLIADEAVRRGHFPVLAGRDAGKLQQLQRITGLEAAQLPIEPAAELRAALSGVQCVLLAAGPYEMTGPLMRAACLDARCSYLDINADVDDFCQALACDEPAREGYRAAAAAAVSAVESLIKSPRTGALTPVQAFGADFALAVPGPRMQELSQ